MTGYQNPRTGFKSIAQFIEENPDLDKTLVKSVIRDLDVNHLSLIRLKKYDKLYKSLSYIKRKFCFSQV
jgi:hypothetical protein